MIEPTSPVARQPADLLREQPPVRVEPDARARIRAAHVASGRRIAVLDDDPTGSQTVHDVAVVTALEPEEFAAGLATPGSTCFILTNTRSLPEAQAVQLNTTLGRALLELGAELNTPIELVSRSDSTLRGHVIAELDALDAVRRDLTGHSYDGVLLAPAYLEAGRLTAGDVHWARVAASCCRSATPSSPTTRPSATAPQICGSSWPRRAAAPSGPPTCTASAWPTSASAARHGSPRSSPA
jgi:hypothetical protein